MGASVHVCVGTPFRLRGHCTVPCLRDHSLSGEGKTTKRVHTVRAWTAPPSDAGLVCGPCARKISWRSSARSKCKGGKRSSKAIRATTQTRCIVTLTKALRTWSLWSIRPDGVRANVAQAMGGLLRASMLDITVPRHTL